jgi:hypothetical protein
VGAPFFSLPTEFFWALFFLFQGQIPPFISMMESYFAACDHKSVSGIVLKSHGGELFPFQGTPRFSIKSFQFGKQD